ncbi:TetR/AcrR family transcriptional regulator [Gordonia sp. (in: high G+C Gram-positive bacteria)]|uniref:TetR/AcrR family transcriptional regulator n=1 Tax=Gordonia sp. (in: high G+C Gram-positive bacteria) TaxID=84139 RepID=UPI003F9C2CEC
MQKDQVGLRERQRAETLRRLHDAAIDLVQENGLLETTISAIADRAGVSRRTFFNYFATKEDAVLGVGSPTIPDDAVDHLFDSPDQLEHAVRVVFSVASSVRHVKNRPAERRELVRLHPELKARAQHYAIGAHDLLAKALAERYDGDEADRASALLLLATAIIRFAYSRDPDAADSPDSSSLADAIDIFKTMMKDLI